MKKAVFFSFLLAIGLSLRAEIPAVITYRGRVGKSSTGAAVTGEMPVTFRLYPSETSKTALWGISLTALLSSGGFFQTELQDGLAAGTYLTTNSLASVLRTASAFYIGVTIGKGQREQYPRQRLLAEPLVERVPVAASLKDGGTVTAADVKTLTTSTLDVKGSAVVTNSLQVSGAGQSMTLANISMDAGSSFSLNSSAGPFLMFARGAPTSWTVTNPSQDQRLVTGGDSGGVLCLVTQDNWTAPCLCIPVNPYQIVTCPAAFSGTVKLLYYSYGTSK